MRLVRSQLYRCRPDGEGAGSDATLAGDFHGGVWCCHLERVLGRHIC